MDVSWTLAAFALIPAFTLTRSLIDGVHLQTPGDGGLEIDFYLSRKLPWFSELFILVLYLLFGLSGIRPIHFLGYISVVLTSGTAYGQKS